MDKLKNQSEAEECKIGTVKIRGHRLKVWLKW
jgi:hypothetical protein